jgi:hypothetical protein
MNIRQVKFLQADAHEDLNWICLWLESIRGQSEQTVYRAKTHPLFKCY